MRIGRRFLLAAAVMMAAGAALGPRTALALDLDTAKAQGWIGERRDGYVGLVTPSAPPEARALVESVNTERRAAYTAVAGQNNVPRDQVEALAGQKLIGRTPPGTFVMDAAGRWIRK